MRRAYTVATTPSPPVARWCIIGGMTMKARKGLRMLASWMVLGAILACGGSDDDDAPPPVSPVAPATAPAQPAQPAVPAQPAQPAMPAGPTNLSLTPGFMPDPMTARGTAGGTVQSNSFDPNCRAGRVPSTPQHTVTLTQDFRNLRIMVNSEHDTTLVVQQPDGTYRCDDDGASTPLDPMVEGAFAPGVYRIYVGTFTGNSERYVLGFSELNSTTPDTLGQP